MPAAAKPKGMTIDVTVSCARGEGAAGQAERVCFDCASGETREQKTFRAGDETRARSRRRAVGALLPRGGFVPEPRAARARETYQRRAPEVDESLRSLDGLCVGAGGEVSARSRREARARGVRGERIPRLYDAQSGVASNISLRVGRPRGARPSRGGRRDRVPSGPRSRSETSLLRKTRAWDARL
jgi:hypothetical protein